MKELLKHILPNIEKVMNMIKRKDSQYLIIVESDGKVETCNRVKHPTKILELHSKMLDRSPSTARLKSVETILRNVRSNNKSSYLGSPTLNEEELDEIEKIADQIEDIINRSVNRWQLEKPKSQFEKDNPKLSKEMKDKGILKSPESKPYMKLVKKEDTDD